MRRGTMATTVGWATGSPLMVQNPWRIQPVNAPHAGAPTTSNNPALHEAAAKVRTEASRVSCRSYAGANSRLRLA